MTQDAPTDTAPTSRLQPPPAMPRVVGRSAFVPLALQAVALVAWLAVQTVQLVIDHQQLGQAQAAIDAQAEGATKLRASLDTLARSTAKLAGEGNANARTIVDELRKRGITINPAASGPP